MYEDRRRAPGMASGPEVEATVKWFNAEKGYGFVEMSDGSGDVFLHIRPLETAGYDSLEPGTRLVVRIGQGQKGRQVAEVVQVDTSTARPDARGPRSRPMGARPREPRREGGRFGGPPAPTGGGERRTGQVKWYNPAKGFGFVALDDGGNDVFLHRSVLARSGMSDPQEGQRVAITVVQGQKGLEATSIERAD